MALILDDVKRIALLARIEISPEDAQATLAQLSNIFGLIEEMNAVDTEGVEPMSHGIEVSQRLREDRVTRPISARPTRRPLRKWKTACTWCRK